MQTMLATVALVVMSVIGLSAQTTAPFPGAVAIDGGWVPCIHPLAIAKGLGCVSTPVPAATQDCVTVGEAVVCSQNDCQRPINIYRESALAAACSIWTSQHVAVPPPPPFVPVVGKVYQGMYASQMVLVIGVNKAPNGEDIVTAQWLTVGWGTPRGSFIVSKAVDLLGWVEVK